MAIVDVKTLIIMNSLQYFILLLYLILIYLINLFYR